MEEVPVEQVVRDDAPCEETALSCCQSSALFLGLWMQVQKQEELVFLWGGKQEFGEY